MQGNILANVCTGCSFNIVFFSENFKYILDSGLSLFSFGVSVCKLDFTLGPANDSQNTSAAAELAEFRKIPTFDGKNTIFDEHPVCE